MTDPHFSGLQAAATAANTLPVTIHLTRHAKPGRARTHRQSTSTTLTRGWRTRCGAWSSTRQIGSWWRTRSIPGTHNTTFTNNNYTSCLGIIRWFFFCSLKKQHTGRALRLYCSGLADRHNLSCFKCTVKCISWFLFTAWWFQPFAHWCMFIPCHFFIILKPLKLLWSEPLQAVRVCGWQIQGFSVRADWLINKADVLMLMTHKITNEKQNCLDEKIFEYRTCIISVSWSKCTLHSSLRSLPVI